MSWHHIRLMHEGQALLVVAGHDRPLHKLFLQAFRCQETVFPGEDEFVYESFHDQKSPLELARQRAAARFVLWLPRSVPVAASR